MDAPGGQGELVASTQDLLRSVAEVLGRKLVDWRSTQSEPTVSGYVSGYQVDLQDHEGAVRSQTLYIETNPPRHNREGVLTLRRQGSEHAVDVWLYPQDPGLPALADMVRPSAAEATLEGFGVHTHDTTLAIAAYRPGSRAVVRVDWPGGRLFVKVVEPAKAATLADRHRLLAASGIPVPRLVGWSDEGLVVLAALEGVDAQAVVHRLPDPEAFLDQIEDVTARLATVPAIYTVRASLFDRLDWYRERLCLGFPSLTGAIVEVARMAQDRGDYGRDFLQELTTIHGDLHLGQLVVDERNPGIITGILDIDTAGAGDPADDAAALYAHLVVMGLGSEGVRSDYAAACLELADRWLHRWKRNRNAGFDDRARAIAATHLLAHSLRFPPNDLGAVSASRMVDLARSIVAEP